MRRLLVVTSLVISGSAFAEEAVEEEHVHHENHAGVFVGATTGLGEGSTTQLTLGAEYEHRLSFITHKLGAGVLIDSALGEGTETLVAAFVAVHPAQGLMLLGGAGVVMVGFGDNTAFAVRGGAAYFFELGKVAVGPAVNIDHANGESAIVYGVAGGMGF